MQKMRGLRLLHPRVFGVTRKSNKFRPRKTRTFAELILLTYIYKIAKFLGRVE